jgi:1,2-phenylacetyl-CoA epoxidase PaaB subunit
MKVWLEDNVPANLGEGIDKMEDRYTEEEQKESIEKTYALLVDKRKDEFNNVMKQVEELEASEEKK